MTDIRTLPSTRSRKTITRRRFVFGDAWAGWAPHLKRWGRLDGRAARDEIAVPILSANRPTGGTLFASPTVRHTLEHYSHFLDFMESSFPDWVPRRAIDGEIYRRETSVGGSGVSIGSAADATIRVEAIYGRVEHVQHVACLSGRVIARISGTIDLGSELAIKQGAVPYQRCDDLTMIDRVFDALGYTGFACVNFKITNDQPKIFEINPRLGGSLVIGPDFDELMTKTTELLEDRWF